MSEQPKKIEVNGHTYQVVETKAYVIMHTDPRTPDFAASVEANGISLWHTVEEANNVVERIRRSFEEQE